MREDCKYFQRRTHGAGDTVSFCALGLAPEAPWRCPETCPRYERVVEAGGPATVAGKPGSDAPVAEPTLSPGAAGVLSSAADIVGRLAPDIEAEEQRRRKAQQEAEDKWWNRLRRSPRWRR